MYNIFLVSHTMSLLLPWFRCRSSQQRKPALVHSLLPAFLIGFAHSLGQDFCILLLPPCSFECPASSEQHACTYAAALESLDLGALVLGFLPPLFRGFLTTYWQMFNLLRQVEQLGDSAGPFGQVLCQSATECPFHSFSLWQSSGHSTLHQQCNYKWICTSSLQFLWGDSRNAPCWAEGRHICEAGHLAPWRNLCHCHHWSRWHIPPTPHQGNQNGTVAIHFS